MKKIIYILYLPLTEKIEKNFYISELTQNGFETEYWDISNIFFNNLIISGTVEREFIRKINSFKELKSLLKKTDRKNNLFIPQITYEWKVFRLFRLFKKYKCKTAFFAIGALPLPKSTTKNRFKKILTPKLFLQFSHSFILNIIANNYKKWGLVKPHDFFLYAGSEGYCTIGYGAYIDKIRSVQIPINSFDYEKYINTIESPTLIDKPYIVFLDEYMPFHPDFSMFNIRTISATKYYEQVNSFFDHIENKFNLKVVIAAHPKANYKTKNPFQNRPIYFDKTCELVKDSEFVVAHASTSISFAILHKKPIYFLSTTGIMQTMPTQHLFIEHFAKVLNAKMILYNGLNNFPIQMPKADFIAYKEYTYKYLTSPESEKHSSKDIFMNFLKNL